MIQVMGEALVDIIIDPQGDVTSVVGGGPLNTARTIARLGGDVQFLGGVSRDSLGQRIDRTLQEDGVQRAIPLLSSSPSTVALASLDAGGAATYRFLLDDTSATAVTPELAREFFNLTASAIHVGTLALVIDPIASAVREIVDLCTEDQLLMVDPNVRPNVVPDQSVFDRTFAALLARADVIKVSGDDLVLLSPGTAPWDAAKELHDLSSATVLFTDGSESVHVFVDGDHAEVEVPKVNVVDTVGAGDSFSGGFLHYWTVNDFARSHARNRDAVISATEFGVRVARITCQRAGAQPPFAHEL